MAIFGFKKRKDEKLEAGAKMAKGVADKSKKATKPAKVTAKAEIKETKAVKAAPVLSSINESNAASVIIRPRITEKSGVLSQVNVYTFEVTRNANKPMISKAIRALYKVKPVKIGIVNSPEKSVIVKGHYGTIEGFKKAIVTLKAGDKIDFV